jgi:serine/threonine protein kinase
VGTLTHAIPARIGPYEVVTVLGEGAMGVVYKGYDRMLGRHVAIKVVAPGLARDEAYLACFHEEARILAGLRHENVVQVHAFGELDGLEYLAMELVNGHSLESELQQFSDRNTFVPTGTTFAIVTALASALTALHRGGVFHGDVKPANVVIEVATLRPVLLDFGVARRQSLAALRKGVWGTAEYMAPELFLEGADPTTQSDQYALACTAHELFTGHAPFAGASFAELVTAHQGSPPPPVSRTRPQLRAVDAVIARALAKEPSKRYPSCTAFARALAATRPPALTSQQYVEAVSSRSPDAGCARHVLIVGAIDTLAEPLLQAVRDLSSHASVSFARSAAEALETFETRPASVIVTLLDLPDLDGSDLLSLLRRLPHGGCFRAAYVGAPKSPSISTRLARLAETSIDAAASQETALEALLKLLPTP